MLREAVFEADTVREVTTVTVMLREPLDRTAAPDTVFQSVVTERDRVRDRVAAAAVREKVNIDQVERLLGVFTRDGNYVAVGEKEIGRAHV